MADFSIHTLGCGSAKPNLRHQPSSTVIDFRNNLFMIDCGEGAQLAMMKARLKFQRLNHIFLTHLHGDHVLGLPGLISTLDLQGEGGEITIHTFKEGVDILRPILKAFAGYTSFEVKFNILSPEGDETAFENHALNVETVRLAHRVPAIGYIFREKPRPRHLKRNMCDFHQVPVYMFNRIKGGEDFVRPDGKIIPNSLLTSDPESPMSYAHISDTAFDPSIAEKIGKTDLLFHETTYLEKDLPLAAQRGHSTARQAAEIARLSGAGWLLTGHYSSRYRDDEQFRREALEVFPNVILNREGLVTSIPSLRH
ncbi:MAG: ribonuclease Z [Muribaculaceae bacterium]|nr:ribonuclease Z [Muribaculaceae bacterium]